MGNYVDARQGFCQDGDSMKRKTLAITVITVKEKRWVHFVQELQVATGSTFGPRIAHNVTSIVAKPQPGDHIVTYNAKEETS